MDLRLGVWLVLGRQDRVISCFLAPGGIYASCSVVGFSVLYQKNVLGRPVVDPFYHLKRLGFCALVPTLLANCLVSRSVAVTWDLVPSVRSDGPTLTGPTPAGSVVEPETSGHSAVLVTRRGTFQAVDIFENDCNRCKLRVVHWRGASWHLFSH